MKKLLFGLCAAAMMFAGQAKAQDAETVNACESECSEQKCVFVPSMNLNLRIANRYMSDGEICNPETMLFGDVTAIWNCGLYMDVWMAQDLNDYNKDYGVDHDPEEFDYTIGYGNSFDVDGIKSLSYDLSYCYWDMPKRTGWNRWGTTKQNVTLDLTTGLLLNPGMAFTWDFDNDEVKVKTHISYEGTFETILDGKLSYATGLELFWLNAAWRAGRDVKRHKEVESYWKRNSGFSTLVWSGILSYQINEVFSCGPFVKLATPLEKTTRKIWKGEGSANHKSKINNLVGFEINAAF